MFLWHFCMILKICLLILNLLFFHITSSLLNACCMPTPSDHCLLTPWMPFFDTYPLAAATTNMPIRLKATMPAAFPSRRTLACNLTTGHLDPDTAGEAIWPTPPRSQSALPWGRPRPPCPPGEPLPLPRAPRAGGEGAELWAGRPSVGRPMMWLMSLASCTPRPLSQEDLDPKVKWQYSNLPP